MFFFPAGGKGLVNVTCTDVTPTSPPSTTIETTSGVISLQITNLIVQSTTNIIERNSDKTSEVSTQVKDTSNKGNSITTQEILDHTRGMQNTGSVSTMTSRRNLSTKTGKYLICQIVHLEQI